MTLLKLPEVDDIEKALIWAMLIDSSIVEKFTQQGQMEWFCNKEWSIIAKEIFKTALAWESVDLVTIKNKLEKKWKLEDIGGMNRLVEATEDAVSYHWESYSDAIERNYKNREIVKLSQKLSKVNVETLEDTVEEVMSGINEIMMEGKSKTTSTEENIEKLENHIEENRGKKLIWWSWWEWLGWLDNATKWIRKGKTYRIGAPSWVGKSNLVYQVENGLIKQWAKVLFISLENSIESTYIKFLSSYQKVNPNLLESWAVKADTDYIKRTSKLFYLTDQLFDIGEIKREIVKIKPDVVILDYIGLVNIKGHNEKEKYDRYADLMKEFIQKNQTMALIDLSNLNKDDNEEKIRMYKGFNWSAKLRNNADVCIHLFYFAPFYEYRRTIYDHWTPEQKEKFKWMQAITFLISKNRLGLDWIEQVYGINFNEGINYKEIDSETIKRWEELSF